MWKGKWHYIWRQLFVVGRMMHNRRNSGFRYLAVALRFTPMILSWCVFFGCLELYLLAIFLAMALFGRELSPSSRFPYDTIRTTVEISFDYLHSLRFFRDSPWYVFFGDASNYIWCLVVRKGKLANRHCCWSRISSQNYQKMLHRSRCLSQPTIFHALYVGNYPIKVMRWHPKCWKVCWYICRNWTLKCPGYASRWSF
jgi:hypothetical protein